MGGRAGSQHGITVEYARTVDFRGCHRPAHRLSAGVAPLPPDDRHAAERVQLHHPHLFDERKPRQNGCPSDCHGVRRNGRRTHRSFDYHRTTKRPAADCGGRHRNRCQSVSAAAQKHIFQERTAARRCNHHRRRPRSSREVHPSGDTERRTQILRHTASRGHRYERDFGRHHHRRLRGDGPYLSGAGRQSASQYRCRTTPTTVATLLGHQHAQTLEKEVEE